MPIRVDSASALRLGENLLAGAGTAAMSVVRHVPLRALLWGLSGFGAGLLAVLLSALLAWLTLGSAGQLFAGPRIAVPLLLPLLGAALFFVHGLHRGVAHAALALEAQWGLVAQIVDRVVALVDQHLGARLHNLPLAQAEAAIKQGVQRFLGSEASPAGGLLGWVVAKVRSLVTAKVETCLLAAYRAEQSEQGGGGVDLAKVRERTVAEVSGHLAELVLGPLRSQLIVLLLLFFGLGIGWFHLGLAIVALLR
ncbi:hypothetical protein DFR29_104185 [Tahibacter aquaticus]|uniref:Uncharacterized protein n=1 Tax=Tahibacter aquaticus TaxID=520092 RepID=A0A4R6Z2E1_9GAMM|nr:hypothetical protein [Tahibacter aquaticus]TDR45757.1 hypothetical protein DFR29_104185 [Tahibacter aquaticus]